VVIGATGFTGQLVAYELWRNRFPLAVAGRDRPKLEALAGQLPGVDTLVVDVQNPASLASAIRRGDVVVNCAGPFGLLGEPVVRAAVQAGAHYLDTTGEQQFMKQVFDRYNAAAGRAGVIVVNAMAFEYAIGTCAAAVFADELGGRVRSVDVIYQWRAGRHGASAGTKRTTLEILTRPVLSYSGGWYEERIGQRVRARRTTDAGRRHAVNFPAGEVVTLPRHLLVEEVRGWLVVSPKAALAARLLSPILPVLVRRLRPLLGRIFRAGPDGPDSTERRESTFTIMVEAVPFDGPPRRLVVSGRDPYGLTAVIMAEGVRRLLSISREGRDIPGGVLDPAQLTDPAAFLAGLASQGLVISR
jgi:short subunit dehydrogenase-like uncharacterized protein